MMNTLKAEFRKLLSIRSTYVIVGIALLLVAIFAGYVNGYKASPSVLQDPFAFSTDAINAVVVTTTLGAIVAILLITHEYRYNTIMYTLTASNSRTKVWLAKILAVSVFAILYTLLMAVASPLFAYMGSQLAGNEFASQTIYYKDILWKVLAYGWGYSMLAVIFATIIRNQIGALATIFIVPSVVEGILTLILKENAKYLPVTSLNAVVSTVPVPGYAPMTAAGVLAIYIAAGWLISLVLFQKRDAN